MMRVEESIAERFYDLEQIRPITVTSPEEPFTSEETKRTQTRLKSSQSNAILRPED